MRLWHLRIWLMKKLFILILVAVSLGLISPAYASPWVDVSSDGNSYLVTGGALFHARFDDNREEAASCSDCYWRVQRNCLDIDMYDRGPCPELLASCPNDMHIAEVHRSRGPLKPEWDSTAWKFTSHTCIGEAGPVSSGEVRDFIESALRVRVPALRVETTPPKRTLIHLPTRIKQLSASSIRFRDLEVAGIPVKLWAESTLQTKCNSCRQTPHGIILKKIGRVAVQVDATWSAWYTALGIRPIKVSEPQIRQRKTLWLTVSQLKARFWKVNEV